MVVFQIQGIVVAAISYYLQIWVIEKKGPVFLSMSMPLSLVFTMVIASFLLGEDVGLGRYVPLLRFTSLLPVPKNRHIIKFVNRDTHLILLLIRARAPHHKVRVRVTSHDPDRALGTFAFSDANRNANALHLHV